MTLVRSLVCAVKGRGKPSQLAYEGRVEVLQ